MRDDIIRMAREAGWSDKDINSLLYIVETAAAAERNKLAGWMRDSGYAAGHEDTTEDLLEALDGQITKAWSKVILASVAAEREACAKLCEDLVLAHPGRADLTADQCAAAIRARGRLLSPDHYVDALTDRAHITEPPCRISTRTCTKLKG